MAAHAELPTQPGSLPPGLAGAILQCVLMALLLLGGGLLAWALAPGDAEVGPEVTRDAHFPIQTHRDPVSRTTYIVRTEEEAVALRDGIAAVNSIRHGFALSPVIEEVVVAESVADADRIVRALEEGNRILASFLVQDRIINLVS